VAYLARTAWEADATPQSVYRDQIRAVCGDACLEDMLTVFRQVEAATVTLESNSLYMTFPVPGMVDRWESRSFPPALIDAQNKEQ
jgi:hypothetical protein